jgi:hypothetical protein
MLTAPHPTDPPAPPAVRPVVAIVTVALTDEAQLAPLAATLVSLHVTQPGAPVIVAAGADSDAALLDQVEAVVEELDGDLVRSPGGAVAAINAGLRAAVEGGVDVLLVGQDVELDGSGWLERLRARRDTQGRPAAVVGGRLVLPGGILAGAGLYFSLLLREWQPRLRYAPADLPAAAVPCSCPVEADLQLVRWEALDQLGLLDEEMTPADANVDFALRAYAAGLECIYEPSAVARRLTPAAPAEDVPAPARQRLLQSARALRAKHRTTDLTPWIPVTA